MASSGNNTTKNIIVNLKVLPSDSVKTIQDLQTKIANLKTTMEGMRAAGMQNSETYIKLQATLKELEQGVRANQKVLRDSIREQQANGDSINAIRAQIRNLRAEYENLSKAERESAQGTELLDKISTMTSELKNLEEAQLDFTRNVGNYKSALEGLPFGRVIAGFNTLSQGTGKLSVAFTNAGKMAMAFGKQLLKLLANPFVAAFAAIAAAVMKLTDAFKKNDEAMTALQSLFAAFKPVLDVVGRAFDWFVEKLTKAINGVSTFVQKVMSVFPFLRKYVEMEQDLVRSSDELEETEREHALNQADRNKEISKLRAQSVESDKYSFSQRKEFLRQALQLEQDNLEEQRNDAAERLRIAEAEAAKELHLAKFTEDAWDKLSDERKNHITELRVALAETETAFNDGTRRMKSQMSSFTEQEKNERKQRAQQAAQQRKERLKNEREALNELEDMMISGIRNMQDREIAMLQASTERQIAQIKKRLETEKNLTLAARTALNEQIVLLEADLQDSISELRMQQERENWKKELEERRKYFQLLLGNVSTEDARVRVRLELNELDTEALKMGAKEAFEQVKAITKAAEKDLSMSAKQIETKYGAVFKAYGIQGSDATEKMRVLLTKYRSDEVKAETVYQNTLTQIDKHSENERLRIVKSGEDEKWSLEKKHKELLMDLEKENSYDAYGRNEAEKTRILLEQSRQRVDIAREEYDRLAKMRENYTDNELAALFGSVEEFNNKFVESELNVVKAENEVKNALKNVAVQNANTKAAMISTAVAVMQAMESVVSSIGEVFTALAESDEKYEGWALAMAEIQILISTAISIAQAIEAAMNAAAATGAASPFTAPVFIAEMVGIVASAIASATTTLLKAKGKETSAPKFAGGGLVGNKTTRRKDDSVEARLTLGEYVIPTDVVSDLGVDFFDRLTGRKNRLGVPKLGFADGGLVQVPSVPAVPLSVTAESVVDYDAMREVFAEAVADIHPVVSVKEIARVSNRVRVKENTAL